ncbi:MAG: c-type cytochrome [Rhodospirillales bacterium]|jgi:cytochrome c
MKYSLLELFGASLLVFGWLVFGANTLGNYLVPEAKAVASTGEYAAAKPKADVAGKQMASVNALTLIASASADRGKKAFKKCQSCHTTEKGGKNKVGPNLWGVVGKAKASTTGFKYSGALKGLGGNWTFADLDAFLTKPKAFAKGTKMTFGGVKKPEDRAALLALLRSLSASPQPLP